ncbi:MAG: hypothetical protein HRT87_03555 [Legionellales bacterium]|nr:hypothetical protein [Legionellales bacterium]
MPPDFKDLDILSKSPLYNQSKEILIILHDVMQKYKSIENKVEEISAVIEECQQKLSDNLTTKAEVDANNDIYKTLGVN